ncbi:MAG: hypothetical protein MUE33_00320 [Cytophagaceae bacterium]|jgi:hypothetical protein|nr:hypothetical protein [Cytophagaceae bacterium]
MYSIYALLVLFILIGGLRRWTKKVSRSLPSEEGFTIRKGKVPLEDEEGTINSRYTK